MLKAILNVDLGTMYVQLCPIPFCVSRPGVPKYL